MKDIKKEIENFYKYSPTLTKRADFEEFWQDAIKKSSITPLKPELAEIGSDYNFNLYEYSISSSDGTKICGLFAYPKELNKKIPVIIDFHGYNSPAHPIEKFLDFLNSDIAVITVNARGQNGKTEDRAKYSSGYDFYTYGILDKNEYYVKNIILDYIKAIDFACEQEFIDKNKIVIEGVSQGGGMAISVCALDNRPLLCLADVPSSSNLEKRVDNNFGSYSSVSEFIRQNPDKKDKVYETLSYVDTMNMADKIKAKVFASVGFLDDICPAKLFFATYNRILSPKEIIIYEDKGHEGGGELQFKRKVDFVKKELKIL